MRFLFLLLPIAILSACRSEPRDYPVPRQFVPDSQSEAASLLIGMGDTDAPAHFVSDIYDDPRGADWRWVGQRPTLKLFITNADRIKLSADFSLWDTAMEQTGPVKLKFLVNGKVLDTAGYNKPGRYHFEKAVPPDWLNTANETALGAEIDKMYIAPRDGRKFGFILIQIGFVPE